MAEAAVAEASREERVEKLSSDDAKAPELDDKSKQLLQAAVEFLKNPQVAKAPMSAKIQYLHTKLKLGAAGVKLAVGMVYGPQAAEIVEKTLQKAAVDAAGLSTPAPAPAPTVPAPVKPWEKNRAKFGPSHLTTISAVQKKVEGEADEWRAVLRDALKHIVTIVDFVPFNAAFATRDEQGEVKEKIGELIEMLDILKEDAESLGARYNQGQ